MSAQHKNKRYIISSHMVTHRRPIRTDTITGQTQAKDGNMNPNNVKTTEKSVIR